jgi:hypothetical protein
MPQPAFVLVLAASVVAWLPLVLAGQTPAAISTVAMPDQRSEMLAGADLAVNASGAMQETSAPFFNPLCDGPTGLWAQTVSAGATSRLSEVELLLLRRSPDITSPVEIEIRALDDTGALTETALGHGSTSGVIPFHRSQASWLTVPLDTPIQLLVRQKVAIFPTSTPSASGACYEWVSSGLDLYAAGSLAVTYDLGESFVFERGKDAAFRTWTR